MRILGIDPGLRLTGYGVLDYHVLRPRLRRWWMLFAMAWVATLLFVLGLQRWQVHVVKAHAAALARWQKAQAGVLQRLRADPPAGSHFMSGTIDGLRVELSEPCTRLKASLFPDREPGPAPAYISIPAGGVAWDDPVRDMVFVVEPDALDIIHGLKVFPRVPAPPAPSPPPVHPLLEDFEPYRAAWIGPWTSLTPLPILWNVLFIAALVPSRYALRLAHAQLATALVCLLGWLVALDHPLSVKGILSNPMLPWGIVTVIVGAVLLRVMSARYGRGDSRSCSSCGYDLTGNVSGICPECGRPRELVAAS